MKSNIKNIEYLKKTFAGELHFENLYKIIYATDASAYSQNPLGVAYPKNLSDLKLLIKFATESNSTLIPRTAGTSIAGQVVGNGLVVDFSKHFTKIIEINKDEKWVRVEPGVILDELNRELKKHDLFFGPETSTSSRCNIGGMVGNNSCGAHSLVYGSTRDHLISANVILSDCSEIELKSISKDDFLSKAKQNDLEGQLYKNIYDILIDQSNRERIIAEFPDNAIKRRNTGYAIDLLLDSDIFGGIGLFNFCKILAGSEGTLAFITEIKLNLVSLPPPEIDLVCVHCKTLEDALYANLIALKHKPVSIELMDKTILDLTKENIEQNKNRFFIKDDPAAILIVEFAESTQQKIEEKTVAMESEMRGADLGYHFPIIKGNDVKKVWTLRKAGLGVLSNMPGDYKPTPVIEDTAVSPNVLPQYIAEFNELLSKYNLSCVYYAHIGTGELHFRPILNMHTKKGVELFYEIAKQSAILVKKYNGSLSGEHGDGRLRGEFIPLMIGNENYELLREIKNTWDKNGVFNAGKITDTPSITSNLRYNIESKREKINTFYNFDYDQGILRAVERCNGSGDCRKTHLSVGGMCPSYQATLDERNTTRARANILRDFLSNSKKKNPFNHKEIYDILDLCLGCKLCKSECPSSVDMAKLKTEFLQQWYKTHPPRIRTLAIAHINNLNRAAMPFNRVYNFVAKNKYLSLLIKKTLNFAPKRSLPLLEKKSLRKWADKNLDDLNKLSGHNGTVLFFADEFTNTSDVVIGIKAISLLCMLGYRVEIPPHKESARTFISKGLLKKAKRIIDKNVEDLSVRVSDRVQIIGIEPSAILSFRDEYIELCSEALRERAIKLASNALLIDEFLVNEFEKGKFTKAQFTKEKKEILFHGHCQQKSLIGVEITKRLLNIPQFYSIKEIPTGCCGMAGSFGFEKEHYDLSMKIGELVLFPAIREASASSIITASGTSCRHQILDGTGRRAHHPVEVLFEAII